MIMPKMLLFCFQPYFGYGRSIDTVDSTAKQVGLNFIPTLTKLVISVLMSHSNFDALHVSLLLLPLLWLTAFLCYRTSFQQ